MLLRRDLVSSRGDSTIYGSYRLLTASERPPIPLPSCHRRPWRRPACPATPAAFLSPDAVFNVATLAVMPFYGLMVGAPRHPSTIRLLSSRAFYLAAAALHLSLLALWAPPPELWHDIVVAAASPGGAGPLPDLAAFAAIVGRPAMTALAWLHLVVLDLFQARWIYLDGMEAGVPVGHSAVLSFMAGPLGLLCHLATKAVARRAAGHGGAAA
jgi:hypothetical protein